MAGAVALIGVAALVMSSGPVAAVPRSGPAVSGQRTVEDTVKGTAESKGSAVDAARGYLASGGDRYHVDDASRELRPLATSVRGGAETVRFQQRHRGVDVLGGQYVVRMERKGGERSVTGTSGRYFTGLTAGTTPAVDEATAVERAVDAATGRLLGTRLPRDGARPLTGTARGLVVLPRGAGVLTRHVTVRGTHPVTAEPVLQEVYVDAENGYPLLQYSGLKTFHAPGADTAASEAASPELRAVPGAKGHGAAPRTAPGAKGPISTPREAPGAKGSGTTYDGRTVELPVTYDEPRAEYLLRDGSRMADTSKNALSTWDARGRNADDVSGKWPSDLKEFGSPTPGFGPEATEAGAVNAQWAAGEVYDYYRQRHGRDSLDGRGMAVDSLVGVEQYGRPYVNAFWDGGKAVYGAGDAEHRTLSAGLDVVGHEMTHGVVDHSAGLLYAGQSGALSEAIADYFGNAIETDAFRTPMDSPDSGLLGESLCRTRAPRDCAVRDLNDGRTTSKSFLGVSLATDSGGVHLNSTIFSGALWDLREDVGREFADRVVYRALTEYLTPLDGFTEGRAAVLAAARDLKATDAQRRAAERAFGAHGIVPGWELALGVDSDVLLDRIDPAGTRIGAGGGWWAASTARSAAWAGRADGTGAPRRISPDDGRAHVDPATDGRTVVWLAYNRRSVDILARPIAGGPVETLWRGRRAAVDLRVDGDLVVFEAGAIPGGRTPRYLRLSDPTAHRVIEEDSGVQGFFPSVGGGRIAYATRRYDPDTGNTFGTEVFDVRTGKRTATGQLGTLRNAGRTAINGSYVFWLAHEGSESGFTALRRADLDGTHVVDLSPGQGPGALRIADVTATDDAVTVATPTIATGLGNEATGKLWQFSVGGERKDRVSCARGEQLWAAAPGGRQVVWIDSTTGTSRLVTRSRPAGRCG
ncbi:M4 family metallopeptidase [Streptomyces sp. NPDC050610]|uniref:M4 family metallopeptidase n=1 Tax=Streptomyces sp. NPDC050610 TaxID=3157097 RepID=UPI00341E0DDF